MRAEASAPGQILRIEALERALGHDRVLEAYDIVLLDTPPALGYLTINGLTAANAVAWV